jgi:hypothetical protein
MKCDTARVFKSALYPAMIQFEVETKEAKEPKEAVGGAAKEGAKEGAKKGGGEGGHMGGFQLPGSADGGGGEHGYLVGGADGGGGGHEYLVEEYANDAHYEAVRMELVAFYEEVEPSKVAAVDGILGKFMLEELRRMLMAKVSILAIHYTLSTKRMLMAKYGKAPAFEGSFEGCAGGEARCSPRRMHRAKTYPIMFKSGDDLRQDQLIMQVGI